VLDARSAGFPYGPKDIFPAGLFDHLECGNARRKLRNSIHFPGRNPPHPIKFALDLANGALMYASRLMKRLSTRSAHASLLKGIAN
jgi:hypothetical protein